MNGLMTDATSPDFNWGVIATVMFLVWYVRPFLLKWQEHRLRQSETSPNAPRSRH